MTKQELRELAQQASKTHKVTKVAESARGMRESEIRHRIYGDVDEQWRQERARGEASGRWS